MKSQITRKTRIVIATLGALQSLPLSAAELPGSVQPGQVERQMSRPPESRSQPAAPVSAPGTPSLQAPANAAQVRFVLTRLDIEGVSAYSPETLRPFYTGLLQREISLADIYQLAQTLTAHYRNDGYILSQVIVPPQAIEQGTVRLKVVEGQIADVRIEGADAATLERLQAYAERIRAARPLNTADLEHALLLMNELPGVSVRAAIVPAPAQPGASNLVLQVGAGRVDGGFSVDNRYSRALGPVRFSADINANNLFGWQERIGLRAITTGDEEMRYLALSYDQPVGRHGGKISLNASHTRSVPDMSSAFIPLDLVTASHSGSVTYSHPLLRSRNENLTLRTSLTAYNGETRLFGDRDTHERIRALRFGLTYDLADRHQGINLLDIEIGQGLKAFGASKAGDPNLSRTAGRPDFTKLNVYASRLQSLYPGWSLLAALNVQYAFTDLLSPELGSFGGEQFGRGYDPSELVGDHSTALKLELRYNGTLTERKLPFVLYGFYDAGAVRQRSPAGGEASTSAASSGIGFRVSLGNSFSGYVEAAKPLTKPRGDDGSHDLQTYAGLAYRF